MYSGYVKNNVLYFLFTVPVPVLEVTTSSNDTLYQAAQQSLFCTVTFPNLLLLPPGGITTQFQWVYEGTLVVTDTRVTISKPSIILDPNSTLTSFILTFSPIDTTDSGNYECSVNFSLVGNPMNIIGPGDQQQKSNISISVEGTYMHIFKVMFSMSNCLHT